MGQGTKGDFIVLVIGGPASLLSLISNDFPRGTGIPNPLFIFPVAKGKSAPNPRLSVCLSLP